MPQLPSDTLTNVVAQLFHFPKADRLQINVPAIHTFRNQFFGKPIDQSIEGV